MVEERIEEVCSRGRLGFRPHGHSLYVFLERFVFFNSVLDGVVYRRRSSLASIEWFLATGRGRKSCFAHGRFKTGKRVHVQGYLEFRMVSGADRNESGLKGGEGHGRSGAALCCSTSAAGVAAIIILRRFVPSFFFPLGVFLIRVSLCTVWQPQCARSFLLHVFW